jgi:DNA-binding NtrC family response regulator
MIRILVIDDDRHMRRSCERVLTNAGAEVICAETGAEGLDVLVDASAKIDAILLDRILPDGTSAIAVIAQIHALIPQIPVVIMSGAATQTILAEAAEAGAAGSLKKPFTPDQLRDAMKKALNLSDLAS